MWDEFYYLFYKDNHRTVPDNLPDLISPQTLAIWLMDDGYRRSDCNALRLNTQAYSYKDHQVIKQSLKRLDIESTIHRQLSYFVTYIPSSSMRVLCSSVLPYIIPSMEYKVRLDPVTTNSLKRELIASS
jgi:LAGLIDADG DNA endonuclease family